MKHIKEIKMKRPFKAILAVFLLLCSCGAGEGSSADAKGGSETLTFFAMDTYMNITAYDGDTQKALKAAEEEIKDLEALISVTDEQSEVYKLDHSGGTPFEVSDETLSLIDFSLKMNKSTGGALDMTLYNVLREWGFTTGEYKVPDDETLAALVENTGCEKISINGNAVTLPEGISIDLGSIGKGEAGDRVVDALKQNGVTSALLDLGGNIQTLGTKPDGSLWRIAVRDPMSGEGSLGVVETADCAVITSGGYERFFIGEDGNIYWHILDPATGRPANSGILSSTVIGKSGRLCDALSTSLFVMGEKRAVEYYRNSPEDFEMILITDDSRALVSEGIYDSFTLLEGYESVIKLEKITK